SVCHGGDHTGRHCSGKRIDTREKVKCKVSDFAGAIHKIELPQADSDKAMKFIGNLRKTIF
ncbi:MAG: hypothetical protein ACOH1I_01970, partial [Gallionellaceae bacterium]